MSVLVTGAAGFIGSHLCERLLRRGHLTRAGVCPPIEEPGLHIDVNINGTVELLECSCTLTPISSA